MIASEQGSLKARSWQHRLTQAPRFKTQPRSIGFFENFAHYASLIQEPKRSVGFRRFPPAPRLQEIALTLRAPANKELVL